MLRRLLTLLAALALTLAACGGDGATPFELVTAAAPTTQEEGTARVAMRAEGGPTGDMAGEGVMDLEAQRGSMAVEVAGQTATIAFDGSTLHLQLPPGSFPGVTTDWVSFDIVAVAEATTGTDLGQLPGSGNNDPTAALTLLESIAEDVEELGEEDVRGESTTHYRAVVDVRKAYEASDAVTDRAQFESFLDSLGTEELPIDVWIDDEGRVRRQSYEQPLPDGGGAMTISMELFDFGTDEPIELPSPEETTDITDQIASATAAAGGTG